VADELRLSGPELSGFGLAKQWKNGPEVGYTLGG